MASGVPVLAALLVFMCVNPSSAQCIGTPVAMNPGSNTVVSAAPATTYCAYLYGRVS